ncbi:MAG: MCP four helix bundle domain-containing protein, partial [Bacteroidota bacterium]
MKWKNLKIRTKIMLSFGMVILILGLVALIADRGMKDMSSDTRQIEELNH